MKDILMLLILATTLSVITAQDARPTPGSHIVCYFTFWSYTRPRPYNFKPEDIDPDLCTHIIYAFVYFGNNYDFDETPDDFSQLQPRIVDLKSRNPNLKILISLGGWRQGTLDYAGATKTQESRTNFAKNVVKLLRERSFDGIDLNWQHPTLREGGGPQDRENYVFLAQTLKDEFVSEAERTGNERLLLAISITQDMKALAGYNIKGFNSYMDFISILSYDYVLSYEQVAKHHAPLLPIPSSQDEADKLLNVEYTINYFLKEAEAGKLLMGIPTYGRTRKLLSPLETWLGADADGPGEKGPYTGSGDFLAYFEICNKIAKENWTVVQTTPRGVVGPYAYKGNQWVAYDDVDMVRAKARYAKQRGLAGVVFWTIDYDDFLGNCDGRGEKYPLINAAKRELRPTADEDVPMMVFPTDDDDNEVNAKPPTPGSRTGGKKDVNITPQPSPTPSRPKPTPKRPAPTPKRPAPTPSAPPPTPTDLAPIPPGDKEEDNPAPEEDLVEDLIHLIKKAGGIKKFCRILRQAKTAFKYSSLSGRSDDMIVERPYLEPLRLLVTNSSITIQSLNIYGNP